MTENDLYVALTEDSLRDYIDKEVIYSPLIYLFEVVY